MERAGWVRVKKVQRKKTIHWRQKTISQTTTPVLMLIIKKKICVMTVMTIKESILVISYLKKLTRLLLNLKEMKESFVNVLSINTHVIREAKNTIKVFV